MFGVSNFSAQQTAGATRQLEEVQGEICSRLSDPSLCLKDGKESPSDSHVSDALSHLPNEILLKIISCLPLGSDPQKAIASLYALGRVNRRLNHFIGDENARGVFVKALLDRHRSLGKMRSPYLNCLGSNLDLGALNRGFGLYLNDPGNEFSKLFSLDQQIRKLVLDLFGKRNVELEKRDYRIRESFTGYDREKFSRAFRLLIKPDSYSIYTPFCFIRVRFPSLSTVSFLINVLGATFFSFYEKVDYRFDRGFYFYLRDLLDDDASVYEFLSYNSSDHQIREIEGRRRDFVDIKKGLRGSRKLIIPEDQRYGSAYLIKSVGEWDCHVLDTAYFICENRGSNPPYVDLLPRWETFHRIYYITSHFWKFCSPYNVIISLFERGKLKSLKEIHAFLEGEVVRMYTEEGKSKKEIVEGINLPFTRDQHPLITLFYQKWHKSDCGDGHWYSETGTFLDEEGLVAKYESGMSTQQIFKSLKWVGIEAQESGWCPRAKACTYFWGRGLFQDVRKALDGFFEPSEVRSILDELLFRFLENGESREEILKDLGLPLPSDALFRYREERLISVIRDSKLFKRYKV